MNPTTTQFINCVELNHKNKRISHIVMEKITAIVFYHVFTKNKTKMSIQPSNVELFATILLNYIPIQCYITYRNIFYKKNLV